MLHCAVDAFWSLLRNTHAAAGNGAFDRDVYLTWVRRELSISLVRGNARLFKKFVGVLTCGIGQRFAEGMEVPVFSAYACGRPMLRSC